MKWSDAVPSGDGIYWVRSRFPHEAFGVGIYARLEGQGVPPQYNDEPHVYMPGNRYLEPLQQWSRELGDGGPPEFIGPLTPPRAGGFWTKDLPILSGHYWVRGGAIPTVMFVRVAGQFTEDPGRGASLYVFVPGTEDGHPLETFALMARAQGRRSVEFAGPFSPPG